MRCSGRCGCRSGYGLPLRHERNVINLPAPHRMRNREVNFGVFCGIIYAATEAASRLEKLRLKRNVSLHVRSTYRRPVPRDLIHKLLLRRNREIHARLRTQIRCEEIDIVLNENVLHGFVAKRLALLRHFRFVRVEPPKAGAHQYQHDDEHNNYLAG